MLQRTLWNPITLFFWASCFLLCGCGQDGKPTGTVLGKVTYDGQPLEAGSINFLSSTGIAAQAKLGMGGIFRVDGPLEAGEYKVYLSPPELEPVAPGSKVNPVGKFQVTQKNLEPNTSGVTATVNKGENNLTLEFKK